MNEVGVEATPVTTHNPFLVAPASYIEHRITSCHSGPLQRHGRESFFWRILKDELHLSKTQASIVCEVLDTMAP